MDVDVEAEMDLDGDAAGETDAIYHTRTHLGAVLQPGDTVLGYYLSRANFNSDAFTALDASRIPDVVLVKKTFPNRRRKTRGRNWKLRSIAKEAEDIEAGDEDGREGKGSKASKGAGRGALGRRGGLDSVRVEADYEHFLRDLEEDPELRGTINLYRAEVDLTDGAGETAGGQVGIPMKRGGRGKAAFVMDTDTPIGPAGPHDDEENEDDGEEEADFPEIQIDELLDHLEDLTISKPA
jgi:nonsense-mediated mRNA decay protein 3